MVNLLKLVFSEYYIKQPKKEPPDEVDYTFYQVAYAEVNRFSHFKDFVLEGKRSCLFFDMGVVESPI